MIMELDREECVHISCSEARSGGRRVISLGGRGGRGGGGCGRLVASDQIAEISSWDSILLGGLDFADRQAKNAWATVCVWMPVSICVCFVVTYVAFFFMRNADQGTAAAALPSAHDALTNYVLTNFGLPAGLLPLTVKDYNVQSSCHFVAHRDRRHCCDKLTGDTHHLRCSKETWGASETSRLV
ncbi:hypothetical protein CBR_g34520 [Chara braunii]|uniref:Uncharacterized protein n=1 Tax=Chara braunii TaxID=69332 RepID=A0A388LIZ0_CHABU|nr:hypothetical protein CBR_g34520 [Chara braunii]|eukprot:GBG82237.1 hypothetical protein CBR_g34520 [Chara braunii]